MLKFRGRSIPLCPSKHLLALLIGAILFADSVSLHAAEKLTVQRAVQKALESSKDLRASILDIQAGELALQSRTAEIWTPSITARGRLAGNESVTFNHNVDSASLGNSRGGGASFFPDSSSIFSFSPSVSVDITYPLYAGGKHLTQRDIASYKLGSSKNNHQATKNRIALQIVNAFYSTIVSKEAYNVQKSSLVLSKKSEKDGDKKFKEGLLSQLDLDQLKIRVQTLIPKVDEAKSAHIKNLNSLLQHIGMNSLISYTENKDAIELVGSLDIDTSMIIRNLNDISLSLKETLNNRAEIKISQQNINIAQAHVELQKSQRLPTISLFTNGNWQFNYALPGTQSIFSAVRFKQDLSIAFGGQISIPIDALFPKGRVSSAIDEAEMGLEKTKIRQEELKENMKVEVVNAYITINQSLRSLGASKEALKLSERSMKSAKKKYTAGIIATTLWLDSQQIHRVTQLDYLRAKYKLKLAWAQYLAAIGKDLSINSSMEKL